MQSIYYYVGKYTATRQPWQSRRAGMSVSIWPYPGLAMRMSCIAAGGWSRQLMMMSEERERERLHAGKAGLGVIGGCNFPRERWA